MTGEEEKQRKIGSSTQILGHKGTGSSPTRFSATQHDAGTASGQPDLLTMKADTLGDDSLTRLRTVTGFIPPRLEATSAMAPDIFVRKQRPPQHWACLSLRAKSRVSPSIPERHGRNGGGVERFAACVTPKDRAECKK